MRQQSALLVTKAQASSLPLVDDMNHRWKVGDRAGIKWVASVCGVCEFCTNGQDELHCLKQTNSGFTAAGTFQQYCLADGKYTTRIPEGVKDEEAGSIMCGGGSPCSLSSIVQNFNLRI